MTTLLPTSKAVLVKDRDRKWNSNSYQNADIG
jgi:hypothetical protein